MGISPLVCAKKPTLDHLDHRVEFMVRGTSQPHIVIINNNNNNNIFMIFYIVFLTNEKQEQEYLSVMWANATV